jgi:peptide/nickel transport system permease protein
VSAAAAREIGGIGEIAGPRMPRTRSGWRRLRRSRSAMIGGTVVLAIALCALCAPVLSPDDPELMEMGLRLDGPTLRHPMGNDQFGRDLFSRVLYGARISLSVAVFAVAVSVVLGVSVGLVSGYYGGLVDLLAQRVVDVFLAFPVLLLAIALVAALGPSPRNVVLALGLVGWTNYARVVRADVLALKNRDFVQAARVAGASDVRIIVRHTLPNVLSPVLVLATLGVGYAIVAESGLSFLGLGVQPPKPSWGWTVAFGTRFLRDAPHLSTFPGVAIMLSVLGFNLLGDGLRDLLDPRSRQR